MRDVKRLDKMYRTLLRCHKDFPDWRIGQIFVNFIQWHEMNYQSCFYIEDNVFVERFKRFIKEMKGEN